MSEKVYFKLSVIKHYQIVSSEKIRGRKDELHDFPSLQPRKSYQTMVKRDKAYAEYGCIFDLEMWS